MSLGEREIYLQDMMTEREELRRQISQLNAQRRQYIEQTLQAKGIDTSRAFDSVIRKALREKLEEQGFHRPDIDREVDE